MAKVSNEPLQPNPFITYRDPKTGLWLVIRETVSRKEENNFGQHSFLIIQSV